MGLISSGPGVRCSKCRAVSTESGKPPHAEIELCTFHSEIHQHYAVYQAILNAFRERLQRLEDAIRKHRDQKGDDRCWIDDRQLYEILGEPIPDPKYLPPDRMLLNCMRFIQSRFDPSKPYVKPEDEPIDMLIFCPNCGQQHIDAPDPTIDWRNPPHRSHLCHYCDYIWRICDRPTNGVAEIKTKGSKDLEPAPYLGGRYAR